MSFGRGFDKEWYCVYDRVLWFGRMKILRKDTWMAVRKMIV